MASLKRSYADRNGEVMRSLPIGTTTQDNIAPPTIGTAGTRSLPATGSGVSDCGRS
jgi:hypothetical protein